MPTEEPPYIESNADDQNPFAEEFTPEDVWTRPRRCSNTAPGLDWTRYAQWKKIDRSRYALNTVFKVITSPRLYTTGLG
jgi:hypothetical protein